MEAQHCNPIWRDRADFIIRTIFTDPELPESEQLWAKQLGEYEFEICCIPCFATNLALGDIVTTDSNYNIDKVVTKSGRWVFRIWQDDPSGWEAISEALSKLGALHESCSPRLHAVDAANEIMAKKVADFLLVEEQRGKLVYETGKI